MSGKTVTKERAWELDFLRGVALILMLFMHFSWDVRYEFGVRIFSYLEKDWFWSFGHPVIVVLVVGVSVAPFSSASFLTQFQNFLFFIFRIVLLFVIVFFLYLFCVVLRFPRAADIDHIAVT